MSKLNFTKYFKWLFLLILIYTVNIVSQNVIISWLFKRIIDGLAVFNVLFTFKIILFYFLTQTFISIFIFLISHINLKFSNRISLLVEERLKTKTANFSKNKINSIVEAYKSTIKFIHLEIYSNFIFLFLIINLMLYYYNYILNIYFIAYIFCFIWVNYFLFLLIRQPKNIKYNLNKKEQEDNKSKFFIYINLIKDFIFLILNINIMLFCFNLYLNMKISIAEFCLIVQLIVNFQILNRNIIDNYFNYLKNKKVIKST